MTIGTKVKQTLASLKSCQADFESFAMETQNKNAKQFFSEAAQQAGQLVTGMEQRVNELEKEEPQYRGF